VIKMNNNTIYSNLYGFDTPTQSIPDVKKKKRRGGFKLAIILVCALLIGATSSGLTVLGLGGFSGAAGSSPAVLTNGVSPTSVTKASTQSGQPLSLPEISAKVSPAVVSIVVKGESNDPFSRGETTEGAGSGILLTKDGYILTNNHVVAGANEITVKLATGKEYTAKLIGTDSQTDLAVLKIDADDLPFVTLGDSDNLKVGDTAVAIGNPLGELSGTVTTGIISATDREITIEGEKMNLLQTDASINPGNSGGALVNIYGEVIGVVNAKTSALGVEGLGFAIPINDAKPVVEQLIKNGHVSGRASLGVSLQDVTEQTAQFYRMEAGTYVNSVTPGSAADEAGIKAGDRIVSIDGKDIAEAADIKAIIQDHSAGDKLKVELDRNGSTETVKVTLKELVQQ
jgi:serine protease Do